MNICYTGPFFDYSGYGEANRHAVAALHAAGCSVQAQTVTYVRDSADFGPLGNMIEEMTKTDLKYRIKILHTTPDQYKKYMEPGLYHIGHFFWETTKVPSQFVENLQLMDEIWTGSLYNKLALEHSGITKPIYVFPQATETGRPIMEPYRIPDFDGYLFYSIFEWTDRKNPQALLDAYWHEFQRGEKVGLLLKTYFKDFSRRNKEKISDAIGALKRKSGLTDFPPIFVFSDLMDRHQISRLHNTGDCFVSAHRGEGWGIPQVEAMLHSKPIISTNCGGVHEYLNPDVAMLVPYNQVRVSGMGHSSFWYTPDQSWADINVEELRKCMRYAYDSREIVKNMGGRAHQLVNERFNLTRVGIEMSERLLIIESKLG